MRNLRARFIPDAKDIGVFSRQLDKRTISSSTDQARIWVDQTLNDVAKAVDENTQKTQTFLEKVKRQGNVVSYLISKSR